LNTNFNLWIEIRFHSSSESTIGWHTLTFLPSKIIHSSFSRIIKRVSIWTLAALRYHLLVRSFLLGCNLSRWSRGLSGPPLTLALLAHTDISELWISLLIQQWLIFCWVSSHLLLLSFSIRINILVLEIVIIWLLLRLDLLL